jgi:hypothetical protein
MFYRKTLDIFRESIEEFDLIVNGIEVDVDDVHILDEDLIRRTRDDLLIIDAAADAGRAIEGARYLSLDNLIGQAFGRTYTLVNNAPTLMHRQASEFISEITTRVSARTGFLGPISCRYFNNLIESQFKKTHNTRRLHSSFAYKRRRHFAPRAIRLR